jgi:hypothetical protein
MFNPAPVSLPFSTEKHFTICFKALQESAKANHRLTTNKSQYEVQDFTAHRLRDSSSTKTKMKSMKKIKKIKI